MVKVFLFEKRILENFKMTMVSSNTVIETVLSNKLVRDSVRNFEILSKIRLVFDWK